MGFRRFVEANFILLLTYWRTSLAEFRAGRSTILIATDVAARGLGESRRL